MSRPRDIARILGKTEAANPDNKVLKANDGVPGGLTVFDSAGLLPASGLTQGQQAYVTGNSRLYITNGTNWFSRAVINATPTLSLSSTGTIALATDGSTTTVIRLTGTDSDNADANLVYSIESGGDFFKLATIVQDSAKQYTITPRSSDSATALGFDGSATITFKASDGVNQATVQNTFTLAFSVNWSSVSFTTNQFYSYDPSSSGQSAGYLGQVVRIAKDNSRMFGGAESGSTKGVFYIWRRSGSTYVNEASFYPGFNNAGNLPSHSNNSTAGFANCFDVDDAGDRAVVNFNGYHTGSYSTHGAVIVLKRTNQSWAAESGWLFQNQGSNNAYHGYRCCMDGTGTYVVAFQSHLGSLYGAGHLYKRTGTSWAYVGSFVGSGVAGGDQFGLSGARMDATGTRIAVLSKNASGKLWIMRRDSTNFSNTELATGDLGNVRSVSINSDGSYVVVGDSTNKNVFVYVRSGTSWSLQQTINVTAVADGTTAYNFGYSVDIDAAGETIVVGNRDSAPSTIWVYTRSGTTWSKQREIDERALDTTGDPNFRSFGEVAINGDADTIVGGGWYVTISGSGQAGAGMMKTYAT